MHPAKTAVASASAVASAVVSATASAECACRSRSSKSRHPTYSRPKQLAASHLEPSGRPGNCLGQHASSLATVSTPQALVPRHRQDASSCQAQACRKAPTLVPGFTRDFGNYIKSHSHYHRSTPSAKQSKYDWTEPHFLSFQASICIRWVVLVKPSA